MAKKRKNKIDHLKVLANTFYSTGFLTIIFASSWWSGLKDDDKIKIKFKTLWFYDTFNFFTAEI